MYPLLYMRRTDHKELSYGKLIATNSIAMHWTSTKVHIIYDRHYEIDTDLVMVKPFHRYQ